MLNYRNFETGELVYYKLNYKSEAIVDKTRSGIIVEIYPPTGTGFSFAKVLWSDSQDVETIAINYLHPFDKN